MSMTGHDRLPENMSRHCHDSMSRLYPLAGRRQQAQATSEARPAQHQQHDLTLSTAPLPAPVASARAPKHPAPTQAQSTSSGSEWSQYTASSAALPALPPALRPTQKSPILPAALQAVLSSPAGTSPIKPSITPHALGAHGPPGGQVGSPRLLQVPFPSLPALHHQHVFRCMVCLAARVLR